VIFQRLRQLGAEVEAGFPGVGDEIELADQLEVGDAGGR
jgi:hypothetical protein